MILPSSSTNTLISISVFPLMLLVSGHLSALLSGLCAGWSTYLGPIHMSKLADPPIFLTLLMDI